MNKWYRSAPVKGVLLLVQHVLVVLAVISLVWLAAYPGMTQDIFSGETETSYARSEGFGQQAYYDSQSILNALADKDDLETDGQLDENKLVDATQDIFQERIKTAWRTPSASWWTGERG